MVKRKKNINDLTWSERNKNVICNAFATAFVFSAVFCIYLLLTCVADSQGRF